ncbi:uncharacterized protein LOC6557010 [Drosophila grimshawi]|uniref:GH16041 n=1 Tax=Drosophila grimshawi TaxID=7222 RepID=B4J2S4_DROGR|nr:uncharacterized protein LOC6557010 [Drosophila grimshawi]XP_032597793.1 uncharacterized protein LOC6557010 [Drosophila grimshawi]EDV96065.1 GH16041 [Drosophila grimshawi]
MRVRDKRKQHKEHKSTKSGDKEKATDAAAKQSTPNKTTSGTTTTTTTTAVGRQPHQPTLAATEKVAFDNRIKRKNVLALNEKVAALREYDRQPVYKHVGRLFNCSPDQIKRIVLQKKEILSAWEQRTRRCQDAKTQEFKVVRVSMLGKAVYDWIRRMMYYKDFIITDGLIQKMALQFKNLMGLNHFFPHQEWCDKFRSTYSIHHNDTKLLSFGYEDSHSVQIGDIAKDIMLGCSRAETAAAEDSAGDQAEIDLNEDDLDGVGDGNVSLTNTSNSSSSQTGIEDEDDADVDVDGSGDVSDTEPDVKPTLNELNARVLQPLPLPQLVRLPQVPPGTSRKVLLATPILPPGTPPGGAQTMTIIPLATLAQSITQRPGLQPKPLPMLDIKQEIKTEPEEEQAGEEEQRQVEEDEQEQPQAQLEATPEQEEQMSREQQPATVEQPAVTIKQELDSEGELLDGDDFDDDDNGGRSSVTSLAEILAANVDDEKQYIEQTRALRQLKRSLSPSPTNATPPTLLPPMPTLTKAPQSQPVTAKRQRQHDDNNNNGTGVGEGGVGGVTGLQSIISCAEARQYLKQLEEFALSKENYRLIELITRADEVMRELADE